MGVYHPQGLRVDLKLIFGAYIYQSFGVFKKTLYGDDIRFWFPKTPVVFCVMLCNEHGAWLLVIKGVNYLYRIGAVMV